MSSDYSLTPGQPFPNEQGQPSISTIRDTTTAQAYATTQPTQGGSSTASSKPSSTRAIGPTIGAVVAFIVLMTAIALAARNLRRKRVIGAYKFGPQLPELRSDEPAADIMPSLEHDDTICSPLSELEATQPGNRVPSTRLPNYNEVATFSQRLG